jgi:hypothetical protein
MSRTCRHIPEAAQASLPPGDGYIVGGVYSVGGPAPSSTACSGRANTVTLENSAGITVATQEVAPGESYVFIVPPGSYTLFVGRVGLCGGSATVAAGQATKADTICPVP